MITNWRGATVSSIFHMPVVMLAIVIALSAFAARLLTEPTAKGQTPPLVAPEGSVPRQ